MWFQGLKVSKTHSFCSRNKQSRKITPQYIQQMIYNFNNTLNILENITNFLQYNLLCAVYHRKGTGRSNDQCHHNWIALSRSEQCNSTIFCLGTVLRLNLSTFNNNNIPLKQFPAEIIQTCIFCGLQVNKSW